MFDGADVVKRIGFAIREVSAGMAASAVLSAKNVTADKSASGQRAIAIAMRAPIVRGERIDVGGQGVEIRADARFGVAERL